MTNNHRYRLLTTTAALLFCIGSLAACASPGALPRDATEGVAASTIVVVATGTSNEPRPALSDNTRALLRTTGAAHSDAQVVLLGPSDEVTTLPLTPRRPSGQVDHGPMRALRLQQNIEGVARALASVASPDGQFDLLEALARASRATETPATVLVVSSGVTTSGGVDLRVVGWAADPAMVSAKLRQRNLLPDLHGDTVIFSGLADVHGKQPALAEPERQALYAYWTSICSNMRAHACRVDPQSRASAPPTSTAPVPVVPVPKVTSIVGPDGTVSTNIPTDALGFRFDSALLPAAADIVLAPLATQARAERRQIRVTGYASPDGGTEAYNVRLSRDRAVAVAQRLVQLGVPAAQLGDVVGRGTAGAVSNRHMPETEAARLRRVVIELLPTAGGSS